MISVFSLLILAFTIIQDSDSLNNGLALTPPMGWISWQRYECTTDCTNEPNECLSEHLIKKMADLMALEGYLDVGYKYLIIDDCWQAKQRDEQGNLQPDPERFPSGMQALAEYVHSKGLKFGLVTGVGMLTCSGNPGSQGYFERDTQMFAQWGVDYLKVLGCNIENTTYAEVYITFGKILTATGRPIVYSCLWPATEGGLDSDYTTISDTCNLWRNYQNVEDDWQRIKNISDWFSEYQEKFIPFHGPGHWNDPDMLVIGNYGLNYEESKAQMAIWSIMTAPLLISANLATIRPAERAILQNRNLISVNQDDLGIMGKRVYNQDDLQVWTKPIEQSYSYAVVVQNQQASNRPRRVQLKLLDIGLNASKYVLTDLYELEKSPPMATDTIDTYIDPHGVVVYRATPQI